MNAKLKNRINKALNDNETADNIYSMFMGEKISLEQRTEVYNYILGLCAASNEKIRSKCLAYMDWFYTGCCLGEEWNYMKMARQIFCNDANTKKIREIIIDNINRLSSDLKKHKELESVVYSNLLVHVVVCIGTFSLKNEQAITFLNDVFIHFDLEKKKMENRATQGELHLYGQIKRVLKELSATKTA